jgi:N-acetylneuraminic acid mutarotase
MEHNSDSAPRTIDVKAKQLTQKSPPARHFHTLVAFQNDLYLFGGLGRNGKVLNDLWKYSAGI